MKFEVGARVWYAPHPTQRFAGVVLGEGTIPQTASVLLPAPYWESKGRAGRAAVGPAISESRLKARDEGVEEIDRLGEEMLS